MWKALESASAKYAWHMRDVLKAQQPIVEKLVEAKLKSGDFQEFTQPDPSASPAAMLEFQKQLREARKRKEHGEVISVLGRGRNVKVMRVRPAEDQRLVDLADRSQELERERTNEGLRHLAPYLK
ncbi:MAG: hypothetical protein H6718_00100 [Polyangiaceae bacterium]|nr:hypothetical protein [Polyangiaceae bacterium]